MNGALRELMDPRGTPQIGARALAPRLDTLAGKTIGLLDNGKPNFNLFLVDLAQLLRAQCPTVRIVERMKPIVPRPVPKEMLAELAASCDAVVTGLGD